MKEHVYGWYPPARDMYTHRGMHTNKYHIECLYKFQDSMYHTKLIPPPSPTLMIRGISPCPPSDRPLTAAKPSSRQEGKRVKSAPIPKFRPVPALKIPTPSQCWAARLAETAYTPAPPTHNPLAPSPPRTASTQLNWPAPQRLVEDREKKVKILSAAQSITSRKDRVKSATIHRERTEPPQRPVKSAGPTRSPEHGATPVEDQPINTVSCDEDLTLPVAEEDNSDDLDFEQQREKYGWAAEVHGNPYGFKKIMKRLPYTVKVPEPKIPPEPPGIHMENYDTFFLNTIPRRPATYTIHKEWMSEVLHAKRMELQKREGLKYRWKNLSFVY